MTSFEDVGWSPASLKIAFGLADTPVKKPLETTISSSSSTVSFENDVCTSNLNQATNSSRTRSLSMLKPVAKCLDLKTTPLTLRTNPIENVATDLPNTTAALSSHPTTNGTAETSSAASSPQGSAAFATTTTGLTTTGIPSITAVAGQVNYTDLLISNAQLNHPLSNGWKLYEHQKEAVCTCLKQQRSILAYDMGLGKTLIGLKWAHAICSTFEDCFAVVVAPVTLLETWRREAEVVGFVSVEPNNKMPLLPRDKLASAGDVEVDCSTNSSGDHSNRSNGGSDGHMVASPIIVSSSWAKIPHLNKYIDNILSLSASPSSSVKVAAGMEGSQLNATAASSGFPLNATNSKTNSSSTRSARTFRRFVVLADEAHAMQNMTSDRTKAMLALTGRAQCVGCILATGTPMKNGRPANIFPLLAAIRHPIARNKIEFEKRYCNARRTRFCAWDTTGASNLSELKEIVGSFVLRKTKEDCLDLPTVVRERVVVPVRHMYRQQFDALCAGMSAGRGNKNTGGGGAYHANDFAPGGSNFEVLSKIRQLSSVAKVEGTGDYIAQQWDTARKTREVVAAEAKTDSSTSTSVNIFNTVFGASDGVSLQKEQANCNNHRSYQQQQQQQQQRDCFVVFVVYKRTAHQLKQYLEGACEVLSSSPGLFSNSTSTSRVGHGSGSSAVYDASVSSELNLAVQKQQEQQPGTAEEIKKGGASDRDNVFTATAAVYDDHKAEYGSRSYINETDDDDDSCEGEIGVHYEDEATAEHMRALNVRCETFTGDLTQEERQAVVDRFQQGHIDVIVCTYGVGSTGLTLTRSHRVILLDRPWTPGDVLQAEDRVRRIGQTAAAVSSVWVCALQPHDDKLDAMLRTKDLNSGKVVYRGAVGKTGWFDTRTTTGSGSSGGDGNGGEMRILSIGGSASLKGSNNKSFCGAKAAGGGHSAGHASSGSGSRCNGGRAVTGRATTASVAKGGRGSVMGSLDSFFQRSCKVIDLTCDD